ncbi:hypothetical protein [Pseudaquabacterium rugosum]|uniref:Apea-like HEPN domain-containing protein n=1 Tax=Pseudaquabacterium rugosum TaxID=2984194 RepID=A0ABU9BFC4_9BURK
MIMDLKDFLFYSQASPTEKPRDFSRVESTLEILQLNSRDSLIHGRRSAFGSFKRILIEYCTAKTTTNAEELINALAGDPEIDTNKDFESEKSRVLKGLADAIKKSPHITVWLEILRQPGNLPSKISELLKKSPETKDWVKII